jgi:glycine/D-amino acid oxidase-like deaminating enzyme
MDEVLVVGSGPLGLFTAYELLKQGRKALVIDAGPDPRSQPELKHHFGATYSGMDARHISITETGPWTYVDRADLIQRSPADGGWQAIPTELLSQNELRWQHEFVEACNDPESTARNARLVYELNRAGMLGWRLLESELPEIVRPINDKRELLILCGDAVAYQDEYGAERALDPSHVHSSIPSSDFGGLSEMIRRGDAHGFFVAGSAYNAKTLCAKLISFLESNGVSFRWNEKIGITGVEAGARGPDKSFVTDPQDSLIKKAAAVIYCTGTSAGTDRYTGESAPQGVLGCWVKIPNPGIASPFKILDVNPEPVNFINGTPHDDVLYLSGGYAWVGTRKLGDVREFVQPTMDALIRQVEDWFGVEVDAAQTEMCIRPAYPTGVPRCSWEKAYAWSFPILVNRGHAAGGFTQAPFMAKNAVAQLSIGPNGAELQDISSLAL